MIGKADLLEGTDGLWVPLHSPVDPAHLQVHGGDVQGVRWIQFTAQDTKRDHNLLKSRGKQSLCDKRAQMLRCCILLQDYGT